MKILVVVDAQNDFINGSLGSEKAQDTVKEIVNVIDEFSDKDARIFVTLDTHGNDYLDTNEGKHLPIYHCCTCTKGWELNNNIKSALQCSLAHVHTIIKSTFGSLDLPHKLQNYYLIPNNQLDITLVGYCTDICVIANAVLLKTYFPEATIRVREDACCGSSPSRHYDAMRVMESLQIEVE